MKCVYDIVYTVVNFVNPEINNLLNVIKLLSIAILENGGETYRAEETVTLLCKKFGYNNVDVMALPTGTFVSLKDSDDKIYTIVSRIKKRSINLSRLDISNTISRKLVDGEISLFEAEKQLVDLSSGISKKNYNKAIAGGISSACFAVLYGGNFLDFFAAMICGFAIQFILIYFKRMDMFHFIISCLGSFIGALLAVIYVSILPGANLNMIVIGAIMPLLPGLALTNAIRDTINGDLVSGISRFGEVLLVAICLASGVGIILSVYMSLGGALK